MWCSSELCGLSQGNYLHISPHLPTNDRANKCVNMDIMFYIKPHAHGSRTCKLTLGGDSSSSFICCDCHTLTCAQLTQWCLEENWDKMWSRQGETGSQQIVGLVGRVETGSTVRPQMVAHLWGSKWIHSPWKTSRAPGCIFIKPLRAGIRLIHDHRSVWNYKNHETWSVTDTTK